MRVYIAGPISNGNQFQNCGRAIRLGTDLMKLGFVPFVPHLSALWDIVDGESSPITYDDWLKYDFAWIDCCDALLRMPGESRGADMEVEYARSKGIPVSYSIADLIELRHKHGIDR